MRRALVVLLALLVAAPAAAAPRASYTDLENELMCVSCNVALYIAESPQAQRQKAELRRLVDAGLTKDEIKDRMVAQYGPNVLADPPNEGVGLVAKIVPIVAAVVLALVAAALLPRWRRRTPERAPAAPALSDADARRLDDELARTDP